VAAHPPTAVAPKPPKRLRWAFWGAVLVVGLAAAGALVALHQRGNGSTEPGAAPLSDKPSAIWPAGSQRAPDFRLADENGKPFTLASYRGRPVILTFIDPLCRNYCPLEARRLNDAVRSLPPGSRPAIVAISVNVAGNARANLRQDERKWQLVPEWRWGIGGEAQLAPVWNRYHVAVLVTTKKIAGVTVHDVAHTEAAYVVDKAGYQRALFLWPYRADAVANALRSLG
jgi:protein SCO1/2